MAASHTFSFPPGAAAVHLAAVGDDMALAGSSQGQVALLQRQVNFCADGWKEVSCNRVACPQGHVNCVVSSISSASWALCFGHGLFWHFRV